MVQAQSRRVLVGLAFVAFISLGLPDGLLGVAWPSISTTFGVPLDALGVLLATSTMGYLLSSASSGRILARINVGTLLALSCLATALSLLGYALSPIWIGVVLLGFMAGFGAGAIDAALNTYGATNFSARTLNWLHACFGIGTTLGPLIVTLVLSRQLPWQVSYMLVGGAQLLLAGCFALTRRRWDASSAAQTHATEPVVTATALETLRLPATWLGIALFFSCAGVEATTGQWAYALFTRSRGIDPETAGLWVSMYWGSFTVARVIFGFVVHRVGVSRLLHVCILAIACGAALLWINVNNVLSALGLVLIGFAVAPLFPSLIALTPERLGPAHTANAIGFQVSAAVLGIGGLAAATGLLVRVFGLEVVGPVIFSIALMLLVLYQASQTYSTTRVRNAALGETAAK